jgi:hypothetical protein
MSSHRGIPFPRLNILGHRTLLKIYARVAVDYVKMNDRMKKLHSAMAICTPGTSHHKSGRLHYRKPFSCRNF